MKVNDFIGKWNEFRGQDGHMQRLDPNHPLDFFIGISARGYEEVALITETEPIQLKSTKGLEVEKNIRKDGRWATQIYSINEENQDIFARLCIDLMDCSQSCKSEAEGLNCVINRYLTWQKLFTTIHETLSNNELKGLISEISFCIYLINKNYSIDKILEAWMGPEGADRDFSFPEAWFEIKGVSTGKDVVRISSLNQLEINSKGFLVINRIDESSNTNPEAFSVKRYVDDFKSLLEDSPNAMDLLDRKLVSSKYIDKKQYEDIYFNFNGMELYEVNETFPKLLTVNVPSEIVRVEYDLSLPGIQSWRIEEESIWS